MAAELERHSRALLAVQGDEGPLLRPAASWWDGDRLWALPPPGEEVAACLRAAPRCIACFPTAAGAVLAEGRARVFSASDPKGLVLHGAVISGALAALALREPGLLSSPGGLLPRLPQAWPARLGSLLRIDVDVVVEAAGPIPPGGVAPALPTQVPASVRRAVAGQRAVVVVTAPDLRAVPGVWAGGFALAAPEGIGLPVGSRVAAGLEHHEDGRLSTARGVVVRGRMGPDGVIVPDHVDWWHGLEAEGAAFDERSLASAVEIPD